MRDVKDVHMALQGKRILVTRTREQASSFCERLRELGAIPVEFPVIRFAPPLNLEPLDQALRRLCSGEGFDWVIFTSANGVRCCIDRLHFLGLDERALRASQIAVIGPATAAALEAYGLHATLMPDEYVAESVAAALIAYLKQQGDDLHGKAVLIPRAAEARDVLVKTLELAGAAVCEVAAYRTLPVDASDTQGQVVVQMLRDGSLDGITFTSSSTVRNFLRWLEQCEPGLVNQLRSSEESTKHPFIACIGPITAATARQYGLPVQVEATVFTIDGLLEAILSYEETR